MAVSANQHNESIQPALEAGAEVLLRFGALMMRAGNAAFQTRARTEMLARRMGIELAAIALGLDHVTISVRRGDEHTTTLMHEIGPSGVNASRIDALELLAKAPARLSAQDISNELAAIEAVRPRYSNLQISLAVGVACGAFASLNGGALLENIAAAIAAAIGQFLRALILRRQMNQFGAAAISAVVASTVYVLAIALARHLGLPLGETSAGFVSSVLYLVPGFPLIAALLDFLQHQTSAALTRFAYGIMIFLTATFGLSIAVGIFGADLSSAPPADLPYLWKLSLRAVASLVGACGFAILFNSSFPTVVIVGLMGMAANELRLFLHDSGMMLAPATFFGAFMVGLVANWAGPRLRLSQITLTVPTIIIMVPGVYAFQTIVWLNNGRMIDALQAAATCGFIVGAMTMGLAAARFFDRDR